MHLYRSQDKDVKHLMDSILKQIIHDTQFYLGDVSGLDQLKIALVFVVKNFNQYLVLQ